MTSPVLSDREKAAVLWAEHVTKNTARSRDDIFEEVRKYFTEPEIVDLTLMSGLFNMYNRVVDSLHIPVPSETSDEVTKIKGTVRLKPEAVKSYLETIIKNWPSTFPEPDAQAPRGK